MNVTRLTPDFTDQSQFTAAAALLRDVIASTPHYSQAERAENIARYEDRALRACVMASAAVLFVAIEHDDVVGALVVEEDRGPLAAEPGPLYVRWVAVPHGQRGKGVAGLLLEAAIVHADQQGSYKLYCDVVFANVAMATALSRAGFRPAGVQWHYEVES